MRLSKIVLVVAPRAAGLILKLSLAGVRALAALTLGRRRAQRRFRDGLAEMGMPPDAIDELGRAYPAIHLKQVLVAGGGKERRSIPES